MASTTFKFLEEMEEWLNLMLEPLEVKQNMKIQVTSKMKTNECHCLPSRDA